MSLKTEPSRPATPFTPRRFGVSGPTRSNSVTRPKGPIYGAERVGPDGQPVRDPKGRPIREVVGWKQPGKSRPCWDLRIDCDGHRWFDRHYAAGRAQAVKEELEAGFRQGLAFDPVAKRFMTPAAATGTARPTVFSEALAWWRAHWATIEPKSRKETLRYICRPITELVLPQPDPPTGVDEYLMWQMLPPKPPDAPAPPEFQEAAAWLAGASLPIEDVEAAVWQAYVDRWRINTRTGRPLAQSSLNRHLADVKQMWTWVCDLHRLPNPWPMVKTGARSSAGGRRGTTTRPVDRTIVLSPQHVRELARLCGEGHYGPLAEVYVLLLGIAGGRPGESAGVDRSDLEVPASGMGEVRFQRTDRRGIGPEFLDPGDDAEWGPLKGLEVEQSRTAPLPSRDATRIRRILEDSNVTGRLFEGWDWDKFSRDVWTPAKALMIRSRPISPSASREERLEAEALQAALSRLRLHDLRHAACSMWLNTAGMEVRVACEWSGHKRLSVFLDIYQGIMPGSQTTARANLEAAWGR